MSGDFASRRENIPVAQNVQRFLAFVKVWSWILQITGRALSDITPSREFYPNEKQNHQPYSFTVFNLLFFACSGTVKYPAVRTLSGGCLESTCLKLYGWKALWAGNFQLTCCEGKLRGWCLWVAKDLGLSRIESLKVKLYCYCNFHKCYGINSEFLKHTIFRQMSN